MKGRIRLTSIRTALLTLFVILMAADLVQAGNFRRYPNRRQGQDRLLRTATKEGVISKPPQVTLPPSPRDAGERIEEPPDDQDAGVIEESVDAEELPPGLFELLPHEVNGITMEYIYTGELFNNARGGVNTGGATQYRGNLDLVLTADLDEMEFAPGGTFFLYGQNGHGRGLTDEYVGDFQTLSNIDSPSFMQVSEFWWERSVLDDLVAIRIGKQDANADFAVVDLGGDFINSSFGVSPTIPLPTFPNPSMAAVVFFQLTDWLSFKTGVWDGGDPEKLDSWGFSGEGIAFSMYELKAEYDLDDGRYPGDFHVGMWYHGGQFDDLATSVPNTGNHGVYLGADQMIAKERSCDEENDQGLGVFVQYGWAPEDRNEVHQHVGGGLVYKGLLSDRDEDFTGVGVTHVRFSEGLPDQSSETAVELFYKAQVAPHIVVQPDMQYIVKPSGTERNALVVGMRFELVL